MMPLKTTPDPSRTPSLKPAFSPWEEANQLDAGWNPRFSGLPDAAMASSLSTVERAGCEADARLRASNQSQCTIPAKPLDPAP